MTTRLSCEDYTVGWVCALPVELAAAEEMLDEEHETPAYNVHDSNIYTCGRVGEHNVVIACLPEGQIGTNSAAAVAVQMKSTFISTRFGLMVGIGGGVPGEEMDVRLGDVVVSKPYKTHGGVVQYDSGKATLTGFERTGSLNSPPAILLGAVAKVRAKHLRGKGKLLEYISKLADLPDFTREAAGLDVLFEAGYNHKGGATCKECKQDRSVTREARRQHVVVHYGTIASGNQVIKTATERDRLSTELGGVLCFEMEAAGLMNSFPCLVIRGICDYADSHKNKQWQMFAAGTAAAYAKEILSVIPSDKVEAEQKIVDVLSGLQETAAKQQLTAEEHLAIAGSSLKLQQTVHKQELTDRQNECLQLFHLTKSTEDATYEWYKDRVQDRVEGTCNWFLQHSNFQRWLNQVSGPLLVSADPGCGKSVLAKYLVNHVLPASATVCYFFFKDQDQNTARQALCALLHQLFSQKPCLLKHAMEQYKQNGKGLIHSTNSLWTILGEAIQDSQAGPIIIVLDALDECAESELEALMHEIENQSRDTQSSRGALRFLMTSRPYEQIIQRFRGLLKSFPHIHIPGEEESDTISDEVNRVIKFRVEQLTEIQNLTANIQADLLDALLKIEHRTYLWVHLVFDYLESKGFKKTRAGVESATKTLPKTVNQAYEKILDKSEKRSIVRKALTIILAAKGALTLSELNIAMEIGPAMHSAQELDLERDEDFKIRLRWLCGLFVSVHHGKVYFLHQTAREFLMGTLSIPTAVPQEMRWHHSITMQDAHKVLAEQCLRYIHLFDCTPELAIHTTRYDHPCHGIYALLHYAAACWPMHFREARLLSTSKDSVVSHLGLIVSDPKSVHFPVWYTKCQTSRDRRLSSSLPHLTVVCFLGHDVLVKTFLDNNADVNAQDAIHGNALQAASEEGHEQIVDMLLDRGAEINVTTKGGVYSNALQAASYRGHRHIVEMLLNRGADVNINARSRYHTNALQAASERGHKQIVELLLDRGANVNAQGGYYSNALQAASKAGHEQIVEILLDRGAEVNAQDGRFGHALQAASYGGHEQIVKLLLDRGADIHAQDGVLGDALQAASMKRHDQIAEMLLNRGALQPKRKEDCVDN